MKLLFISNLYPPLSIGGYEQICHDVATALRKRGHQITILTSLYLSDEAPDSEPAVRRQMKLHKTWEGKNDGSIPWLASNRFDLELHNSNAVRRAIHDLQPDLVVIWGGINIGSTFFSTALQYARVAFYLSDYWLSDILAIDREISIRASVRSVYRSILSLFGASRAKVPGKNFMLCSESLRRSYEDRVGHLETSQVIYHGVSSEMFPHQRQHLIHRARNEPFRILYVGQIREEKGISTLIRALAEMRTNTEFNDATLTLVGPTPSEDYAHYTQQFVKRLDLTDAIIFTGTHPRSQLAAIYAAHDILAFPSEWAEPFSVTLLEGMSTGIPVVASLAGGSAEIIRDGENALAFNAGNATDLAAKMTILMRDRAFASRLGATAATLVREEFSVEREVDNIEGFLQSLIK